MNVVSFFDGISCGQIALNKLGIKYSNYFAAEIKPLAIQVTKDNYPNTIHIGDVSKISFKDGVLYTENDSYHIGKVDLFIGGSPCQDFSQANLIKKGLEGKKSQLFFEFLRFKNEANPTYWLLENVVMDNFNYHTISNYLNTTPVNINSKLVSAQLRDRLYWTNIGPANFNLFGERYCAIPLPKDKKIKLENILENGFTTRKKSRALLESDSRPLKDTFKMFHRYYSSGFTTVIFKNKEVFENIKINYLLSKNNPEIFNEENIRYLTQLEMERLQTIPEGYTRSVNRNEAAGLLGDGWTVDVISHIFQYIK